MGPAELAAAAARPGQKPWREILAWSSGAALLQKNYPLIHAVGQGSARAPRLIELIWGNPRSAQSDAGGQGRLFRYRRL